MALFASNKMPSNDQKKGPFCKLVAKHHPPSHFLHKGENIDDLVSLESSSHGLLNITKRPTSATSALEGPDGKTFFQMRGRQFRNMDEVYAGEYDGLTEKDTTGICFLKDTFAV